MADLNMESRQVGDVVVICPHGFINAHTVRHLNELGRRAAAALGGYTWPQAAAEPQVTAEPVEETEAQ